MNSYQEAIYSVHINGDNLPTTGKYGVLQNVTPGEKIAWFPRIICQNYW